MAEIVNLRTVRKRILKQREADRAAENRLVHGTTKVERALSDARRDRSVRLLDQHHIDMKDD